MAICPAVVSNRIMQQIFNVQMPFLTSGRALMSPMCTLVSVPVHLITNSWYKGNQIQQKAIYNPVLLLIFTLSNAYILWVCCCDSYQMLDSNTWVTTVQTCGVWTFMVARYRQLFLLIIFCGDFKYMYILNISVCLQFLNHPVDCVL